MKTNSDMNPPNQSESGIFDAALACASLQERAAYLDEACAGQIELRERIEALLAAHDLATGFLENPQAAAARPTIRLNLTPEEQVGQRIGRYKLLQKIGEGGCGVVYMAEQEEPVRRRVALKVIKLGMDTKEVVARFEAERQALALMDHPNIARVLDAGATEQGRPFFVMELVKGIPATRYADENKLDTRQRLDLFIQICQAVQHAHQKGIIHRDLKPSNVLVADHDGVPVPKVIDFGIAKATTDQRLTDKTLFTALEQFIGTPAYMSPEQAKLSGLDVDTRSDIYSLGVLLYELLTGKTPFDARRLLDAGFDEIRRIIREEEPPKPSTRLSTLDAAEQTTVAKQRQSEPPKLLGGIRGDLDWIVMKCLEKDRTRRYETANGLAADVQRHLSNEPVVACPPSAAYRFQKMVRRNKAAFAITTTVVSLVVIGLSVSTWLMHRALNAETSSRLIAERLQAEQMLDEVATRYDEKDIMGMRAPKRFYLKGEVSSLPGTNSDQDFENLCRRALELLRKQGDQSPLSLIHAIDMLVRFNNNTNKTENAALLNEALELKKRFIGNESAEVAGALEALAWADSTSHTISQRIAMFRESIAILKKIKPHQEAQYSDWARKLFGAYIGFENFLREKDCLVELEKALRESLSDLDYDYAPKSFELDTRVELAHVLLQIRNPAEAELQLARFNYETNFDTAFAQIESNEKSLHGLISTKIEIYSALHQTNQVVLWQQGLQKLDELGRKNSYAGAVERADAAEKAERIARSESEAHALMNQVSEYWVKNPMGVGADYNPALTACRKALAIRRQIYESNNINIALSLDQLSDLLSIASADRGDEAEAEAAARESLAIKKEISPTTDSTVDAINRLIYLTKGKNEEVTLLREILRIRNLQDPVSPKAVFLASLQLADALLKAKQFPEAEIYYRKLLSNWEKPETHGNTTTVYGYIGDTKLNLADALAGQGKTKEADDLYVEVATAERYNPRDNYLGGPDYYFSDISSKGAQKFLARYERFYRTIGKPEVAKRYHDNLESLIDGKTRADRWEAQFNESLKQK